MAVTFRAAEDLMLADVEALGKATQAASSRLARARDAVVSKAALVVEATNALTAAQAEATAAETAFATLYAQIQAALTETN